MKRAAAGATEPGMKRVRNGDTELVITEEVMERVTERVTDRVLDRVMDRMERTMGQVMQGITHLIETLSKQSAPADCDVNPRPSHYHQIKKSEERELRLVFANKLPDKIFTRDKIRDERDEFIQIKLIDSSSSWKLLDLDPLSSIEIEIVVLDGDFGSKGNENWTEQEFNAKIVQPRISKGPLVKGKQNITLIMGVGIIDDLGFCDNSSWKDCGKFRLGARVLQRSSMGQERIKEAISQDFTVRDYRTRDYHKKTNKKHDLLSLEDDVWRLKKITKGGKFHTRLIDNDIHTIRNFKRMCKTNAKRLREILRDCSDSDWDVILKEASCVVDDDQKLNNAYSNPLISPTTGPLLRHDIPVPHKGMQNYTNHAPSSYSKEIVPNLDLRHLTQPIHNPVNTQREHNTGIFHSRTNGDPTFLSLNNNPTKGSQPHDVVHVPQQGSVGMEKYSNHVPSSDKIGLSTVDMNLSTQPLVMSTCYTVNAQGAHINGIFHPPSNGDSRSDSHFLHQNSSQLNGDNYLPSLNNHAKVGPYNDPTTNLLRNIAHDQGSAGMQKDSNHVPSSDKIGMSTADMNLSNQPLATSTYNPMNAQGAHINGIFHPPTNGDSGSDSHFLHQNSSQLNGDNYLPSLNNHAKVGPYNDPTTNLLRNIAHDQGSAGTQKDSNHVPSSDKIGMSTADMNLSNQPLATSTCNPMNAQGAHINGIFHPPTNGDSGSDSHFLHQNSSQLNGDNYLPSLNNHAKFGSYNDPTTDLLRNIAHRGSAGMQKVSNHVPSCDKIRLSTADMNLSTQPLAMSPCYPVNAQGAHINGIFHPPTNGDSGFDSHFLHKNSSQLNGDNYLPSLNNHAKVGPYNDPTTYLLRNIAHDQGSAGMQKDSNNVPSSDKIGLSTADMNLSNQPLATSTHNPMNAQGAHINGIFHPPTNGDSGSDSHFLHQNSSQLNGDNYLPSLNNHAKVGPYNDPTTDLLHNIAHDQGMQNDSNHVPSSDKIGLSTADMNLSNQPLATSTSNPVNAQGAHINGIFHPPTNGDSGSDSHFLHQNSSQLNGDNYLPSLSNHAKVGPYNDPTTDLLRNIAHDQGFAGMQKDSNHVPSSDKIGLSTADMNLSNQPLATSTSNPVNAQGAHINGIFHPPTNGDSGSDSHFLHQNSSQLNGDNYLPSLNNHAKVGPYNNPTTNLLRNISHDQGSAGMQKDSNHVPSSDKIGLSTADMNLSNQPLATSTSNPVNAQGAHINGSAGMQKDSNHVPSSDKIGLSTADMNLSNQPLATSTSNPVNAQGAHINGIFHPPTNGDSGSDSHFLHQNSSQFNGDNYLPSLNNHAKVGPYNNPITDLLRNISHDQGSAGMQKDSNHVPSSDKIGLSTVDMNLSTQPLAMSTSNHVNAQGAHINGIFHPPTNGDSGSDSHFLHQNSSQLNGDNYLPSLNNHAKVGPYNDPTTDLLHNIAHDQGSAGMHKDSNHVPSSDKIGLSTADMNLSNRPLATSTHNPMNAQGAHINGIFHPPTNGDLGSDSHFLHQNSSQFNGDNYLPSLNNHVKVGPYNDPTTDLLRNIAHDQGSAGMQKDSNHVPSSDKIVLSTAEMNLSNQPLAMSTSNPMNAQGAHIDGIFHPPTNGDSGSDSHFLHQNSSQLNGDNYFPSLNNHAKVGPYNDPTTDLLHNIAHDQGSAGMQNDSNHVPSSDKIGLSTADMNLSTQPLAMSTCYPVNYAPAAHSNVVFHPQANGDHSGSGSHFLRRNSSHLNNHFMTGPYQPYNGVTTGMQNPCNQVSSSYPKSGLSQEIVPGWNSSQLNKPDLFHSPNTQLTVGSSQNNSGPHSLFSASQNIQNAVNMSPAEIGYLEFNASSFSVYPNSFVTGSLNVTCPYNFGVSKIASVDDEKFYAYSVEGIGLLFNFIYMLVAKATFDGHNYQSVDKLSVVQKSLVESKMEQVYKNVNNFDSVDGRAIFGPSSQQATGLLHPDEFLVPRSPSIEECSDDMHSDSDSDSGSVNILDDGAEKGRDTNEARICETPVIGMTFDNDEDAYQYYNSYARSFGFSVRKQRLNRNRQGVVRKRLFTCSCEGSYSKKATPQKKKEERRCECEAMLEIKMNKNGKYVVTKFIVEHTHDLVPASSSHILRSQRKIQPSQAGLINQMHSAGLKPSQIFSYMATEVGGSQHLNFIEADCNNFIMRKRAEFLKKGDAQFA
ncbi:hypothetical protein EZV62_006512 [Acer yangbiense]|uniref:Uncharacterized protein n=1 Tax=Acer yangbiense TaxID=1000413 RepID=A0A5C7I7W6_9ROSI|nr:hypothetical protein EZV62_006512 [Acer yangbiense]